MAIMFLIGNLKSYHVSLSQLSVSSNAISISKVNGICTFMWLRVTLTLTVSDVRN